MMVPPHETLWSGSIVAAMMARKSQPSARWNTNPYVTAGTSSQFYGDGPPGGGVVSASSIGAEKLFFQLKTA
jgi:hypothetical protein